MLKKIVYRLLQHRHFWRDVGFDELSEIYISNMLRGLAVSLTGLFIPLYMYGLGYSVKNIMMVAAWYFIFRGLLCDLLSGYTVAKIGPKHTLLIGYCILIASTILFLTLKSVHWPIWELGGVWGASASFFFVPFHVDFSKIKHKTHSGKEIGYMNIMEKIGFAIGPVVGGVIATIFGPQYLFLVSVIILLISIVPLFRSAEPVKTRQKLDFKSLNVGPLKRDLFSYVALGIENTLSVFLWPLYLAVFVLATSGAYTKLGFLSSISMIVSIMSTYVIGKLTDRHHGRRLLRISTIINAGLHLVRPFIQSYGAALGVNLANETVTVGYRMPYTKGYYDAADDLPGHRIVYITAMEMISCIWKALLWLLLAALAASIGSHSVMLVGFTIAALSSLLIMSERFKALNPRRIIKA